MYCPRCRVRMRLLPRIFHKQRKWVCPRCSRVRLTPAKYYRKARSRSK